jgi:hypothetical protein
VIGERRHAWLCDRVSWLIPNGELRCFLCESNARYPVRDIDPDTVNPDLREAHRRLWSKPIRADAELRKGARWWRVNVSGVGM